MSKKKDRLLPNYPQRAINATFYANPVKLQQLIDDGNFNKELLEDIYMLDRPFPIWRIPQCWEISIGDLDNWAERASDEVKDFLDRIQQIKLIYQNTFGVSYSPIDYRRYAKDLRAPDEEESFADILGVETNEEVYADGARPIDVDLYCSARRYDLAHVKELLIQGANPSAILPGDDENLYDWLVFTLGDVSLDIDDAWYDEGTYPVEDYMIASLVRSAALEEMYQLVHQYDTTPIDQRQNIGQVGEF